MRADIHDGPEHMIQSEAGYIDARPLTPARQNLLQRTAGPYMRVTSGPIRQVCPQILSTLLHPQSRSTAPQRYLANCRLVGPVEMDTIYPLRDPGGCHARSTKRRSEE